MVDSTIQRLLEKAIDSPIKLQLCLLFDENKRMQGSAAELANHVAGDRDAAEQDSFGVSRKGHGFRQRQMIGADQFTAGGVNDGAFAFDAGVTVLDDNDFKGCGHF